MSKCIKLELPADLSVEPCAIGEPVDWTKLQVLATYEDNTQTTLPVTPRMLNESSLQTTASVRKSIIICEGQRVPILIPIKNTALTGIEAEANDELIYREGERFEMEQAKVTAFYSDGSSKEVHHYKITPNNPLEAATTEITIRYGRCTATLPIKVLADTETLPAPADPMAEPQKAASEGEPEVVMGTNIPGEENRPGQKSDTGVQPGVSAEPKPEPTPTSHTPANDNSPGDEEYPDPKPAPVPGPLPGDSSGAEAALIESPATPTFPSTNPPSAEAPFQQPPATTESTPDNVMTQDISRMSSPLGAISGAAGRFPKERMLSVVSIAQMPHKLKYTVGESEADLSGGRLNLIYTDGGIEQVDMSADGAINLACSISGHGCVAFTYKGKPVTYPIQVVAPVVAVGIELSRMPYKAIYEQGSLEIDMDGAELEVRLSNGGSERVPVNPDMIGPFSFIDTGKSNILIMYKGFSVLCPVIVVPKGANIPVNPHSPVNLRAAVPEPPTQQHLIQPIPPAPSAAEEQVPPPAPEPTLAVAEPPKEETLPEKCKEVDDIDGPEGDVREEAEREVGEPPKPAKDVPNFYVSTFGLRFPVELG